MLGPNLDAFLLGNVSSYGSLHRLLLKAGRPLIVQEPDLYEENHKRPANYTVVDYVSGNATSVEW